MDRQRIEQARRDFDRRELQFRIEVEQRAVDYFTKHEQKYTEEKNDYMRAWCKKQRKKRQSDLVWAKAQLAKYESEETR